jgi:hypothetical protein
MLYTYITDALEALESAINAIPEYINLDDSPEYKVLSAVVAELNELMEGRYE